MSTKPIPTPDWFDTFWESQKHNVPVFLRNDHGKKIARAALEAAVQSGAQLATTPQGIRGLIAMARITAILKGVGGVLNSPDPSPEEVTRAVEELAQRVRP